MTTIAYSDAEEPAGTERVGSAEPQIIAPLPRVSIQAFCETPDVERLISTAASDRRMEKAHVKVQMGGGAAAVEAYRNSPTPNVILLESSQSRDALLHSLERLAEVCDIGTKVVVVGRINDVLFYRDLIRRGVSEYLVVPFQPLDLVQALSTLFRAPGAEPVGRSIAFLGAKGGVGSSTVAHNVSWSIARSMAVDSVVVDMDMAFGTAGLDFNQDPPQGVADAVFSPERLDANLVDKLLARCTDNLSLMAAPSTLDRVYDFKDDAFDPLFDILRSNIPCIVLDIPHVWTGWSRRALAAADEVVIVAAPDLANLRNAKNLLDLLRSSRPNDLPPRLVLSQVGVPKRPEIKSADFAKALDVMPIAEIPFDPQTFGLAANNGQMIAEIAGGHPAHEAFEELARILTGKTEVKTGKRNLLEPFLSRIVKRKAS